MKKTARHLFCALSLMTFVLAACDDENPLTPGGEPGTSGGDSIPPTAEETIVFNLDSMYMEFTANYPTANYGYMCELLSDNMTDNNAPNLDSNGNAFAYDLTSYEQWMEDLYAFRTVSEPIEDSPMFVYNSYTGNIDFLSKFIYAVNEADADSLSADRLAELKAMQGEAYVLRSYLHFVLANIFYPAYGGENNSKQGMPYRFYPATDNALTVEESFMLMREDMERGMDIMEDAGYPESKFRFNRRACHAYAARLCLFMHDYNEAIAHANEALGSVPVLRDFTKFNGCIGIFDYKNVWQSEEEPAVFMMLDTYSMQMRNLMDEARFAYNGIPIFASGLYGFTLANKNIMPFPYFFMSGLFVNDLQKYGLFSSKIAETFEYTDEAAGIGYPKLHKIEFTAEETLLCRAEARLMAGTLDEALEDLRLWAKSKVYDSESESHTFTDFTMDDVVEYYIYQKVDGSYRDNIFYLGAYNSLNYDGSVFCDMFANIGRMGYDLRGDEETAMLRFLMHLRRTETVHDGLRFFDVKRFGVEYKHYLGHNGDAEQGNLTPIVEEVLTFDDPRRCVPIVETAVNDSTDSKALSRKGTTPLRHSPQMLTPVR